MTNPSETLARPRAAETVVVAVLTLCLGAQPSLGAQPAASAQTTAPERVQLGYAAPPGCPSREAFVATLEQRTDRLVVVESSEPSARALGVRVVAEGKRFVGELEIAQDGRPPSVRRFEDASCDQVVAALALIVVLSATMGRWSESGEVVPEAPLLLEPSSPVPPALTPESLEEPPGPPLPELHKVQQPGKPRGNTRQSPAKPRPALARPTPARSPTPNSGGEISYFLGASLAATDGPASVVLLTPAPTLGISAPVRPLGGQGLEVDLTPVLAKTGFLSPDAAGIAVRWMALRVGLCPRFELGYGLAVLPCLRADGGVLTVENDNPAVETLRRRNRPWFALGPGAALGWGETFNVKLGGALLVPVVRDKFVVVSGRGSESAHRPGRFGGDLELRLGWRFL